MEGDKATGEFDPVTQAQQTMLGATPVTPVAGGASALASATPPRTKAGVPKAVWAILAVCGGVLALAVLLLVVISVFTRTDWNEVASNYKVWDRAYGQMFDACTDMKADYRPKDPEALTKAEREVNERADSCRSKFEDFKKADSALVSGGNIRHNKNVREAIEAYALNRDEFFKEVDGMIEIYRAFSLASVRYEYYHESVWDSSTYQEFQDEHVDKIVESLKNSNVEEVKKLGSDVEVNYKGFAHECQAFSVTGDESHYNEMRRYGSILEETRDSAMKKIKTVLDLDVVDDFDKSHDQLYEAISDGYGEYSMDHDDLESLYD